MTPPNGKDVEIGSFLHLVIPNRTDTQKVYSCFKKKCAGDFPGGPVVKTPCYSFDPWSINLDSHMFWGVDKKMGNYHTTHILHTAIFIPEK